VGQITKGLLSLSQLGKRLLTLSLMICLASYCLDQ